MIQFQAISWIIIDIMLNNEGKNKKGGDVIFLLASIITIRACRIRDLLQCIKH